MRVEAAHPGAIEQLVPVQRLDGPGLKAAALEVDLQPDAREPLGTEGEGLVQRREVGREPAQALERALSHRPACSAVADLVQVVRMREHERPVLQIEDVELEHVATELDGELQGSQRVLWRQRGRTAVPDAGELPVQPSEVDQPVRLTTTTAQSSASSPRAKERQWSRTTCASSPGESCRLSESRRSSRSTPYSSLPRRASMTPSVYRTTASPGSSVVRTSSYS